MAELNINLTDDPLKNIILMAPYLDEPAQNRVFGMICGLIGFNGEMEQRELRGGGGIGGNIGGREEGNGDRRNDLQKRNMER